MKKIYSIVLMMTAVVLSSVSCWKTDFPDEATPRPEVGTFEAVAGDEQVMLSWTPYEGSTPIHYLITYDENQETQTITTTETSYVIENLQNDVEYIINLQAVYEGNLVSNMKSKTVTPLTTRFPVKVLSVESGDACVDLSWEKPHETLLKYKLSYWIEGEDPKTVEIGKDQVSYHLDGLENVKIYNIALYGEYERGLSSPITSIAMPCEFAPYEVDSERLVAGKPVTFRFNIADYPSATNIVWNFDGDEVEGAEVKYSFWAVTTPEAKLSVNLDGSPVTWPIILPEVEEYVFDFSDFSASGDPNTGFYSSTPVFSPDRKTVYQITTANTTLYAIDIETGEIKWYYKAGDASKFSASVNPVTGDILFGTAVAGGYYCVSPDGNLKWQADTDAGFSECGPAAISKDGSVVYVGDAGGSVYAIDAKTGNHIWKNATGGGLAGGVIVNGEDVLYGNNAKVYFLKASDGSVIKEIDQQMWKTTGFAASPDRKYVYLSCKNGASLAQSIARLDLEKRDQDKVLQIGGDNTWGIAISPDGSVFAGNKDGYLYCVEADLSSVRWSYGHMNTSGTVVASSFNFSHPVADREGNFIITSTGNDAKSYSTTYWLEGATGKLKASWHYSGDVLGDGKTYSQQAGNNLIDGYFFSCYNGTKTHPGSLLCKFIGAERADGGWASIGGDIFNSNCIK